MTRQQDPAGARSTSSTTSPPARRSWSQKGNPKHISSLDDLCGKTVALEKGTTQEDVANAQATKCTDGGKGKITILPLDKDTDALQQLKIGRSDADMNDFPVAAYNAKTSGGGNDFEVVGQQFQSAPYGIAVRKDQHPAARRRPGGAQGDHRRRHLRQDPRPSGTSPAAR